MPEYSVYRDAIAAQVATVADAGRVYAFAQHAHDQRNFFHVYATTIDGVSQVRGWWVDRQQRRVAEAEITDTMGSMGTGQINWAHTFIVIGVMGRNTERDTDAQFGDLVDDVMDTLTLMTRTPTEHFPGAWQVLPPRLRVQELRMFGDVLVHYCEIIVVPNKRTAF